MKTLLTIIVMFLITLSFGAGVLMGWDAGVKDGQHLATVTTP